MTLFFMFCWWEDRKPCMMKEAQYSMKSQRCSRRPILSFLSPQSNCLVKIRGQCVGCQQSEAPLSEWLPFNEPKSGNVD